MLVTRIIKERNEGQDRGIVVGAVNATKIVVIKAKPLIKLTGC